jgi:sugar transferase (PEP-CTERM/EpsH1 system associated)
MKPEGGPVDAVRVMHVVAALRSGGMERGVVKLVNGLDPTRVRSMICSTQPAGPLRDEVESTVPVFELDRRDGNDIRLPRDLYRLFRRERPDIVHTHAWGTLLEGLLAARLARVPVVVHGEHGTLQLRRYQRYLQRWGWSAADQVLSVSSRLADRMAAQTGFARDRIHTIRNGVDLSRFGAIEPMLARAALGVAATSRVIVTVGRLVPVKAHRMLLDSVALLRGRHPDATLILAGDGPLKGPLTEQAAALSLGDSVRFLGERADVETVLAAGDVFVLSSDSEGLSNTILEAMASRLPVVATDVGGAAELVRPGETGWLVRPYSAAALAEALDAALSDGETRQAMGRAGRRRAEAEFGLDAMVRRYERLYCEAAAAFKRLPVAPPATERSGAA